LGGVGLVVIGWRRPTMVALVVVPLLIGPALALTQHYPLYQRLAVYLVPSAVLLVSAGAVGAAGLVQGMLGRSSAARAATVVVGAVAATMIVVASSSGVWNGLRKFAHPDEITAAREAVAYIGAHQQPGDLVLIEHPWAAAQMTYYGPGYGVHASGTFTPGHCRGDQVTAIAGLPRVWLYMGHLGSTEPPDRSAVFLSHFEQYGSLLESYHGAGDSAAYLLDFSHKPTNPEQPRPLWEGNTCVSVSLAAK
jgi:hypothetical protein